jgi:hypothetical protein
VIKIVAGRQVRIENAVPGASGFNLMVKTLLKGREQALKQEAASQPDQTNVAANSQNRLPKSGSDKPEEISSIVAETEFRQH